MSCCSPKAIVEEKLWEKLYQIETIQNHTKGKMRKAEYVISSKIFTCMATKLAGVHEETLAKAREKHEEVHVHWGGR